MMTLSLISAREIALFLALFFNPFGFDAIFKFIMSFTHSYWLADAVMYGIAGIFFIIYLILVRLDRKKNGDVSQKKGHHA